MCRHRLLTIDNYSKEDDIEYCKSVCFVKVLDSDFVKSRGRYRDNGK